eukprot:Rmarinus@m.1496
MPKGGNAKAKSAEKKADLKRKEKIAEDKTFGLKNKNKSKKVAQYVKTVQQQYSNDKDKVIDKKKIEALKLAKEEQRARKKEVATLFKPVQKLEAGADPKSQLCSFFKQGMCSKGDKCKFSHDMTVERKAAKIDLYSDKRDTDKKPSAGMESWDQETLEQAVKSREYENQCTTNIVCKHFLEAIEKQQYGWFWVCPNGGGKCKYRHALPPGFVLKTAKKDDDGAPSVSLEEAIEEARKELKTHTPVTLETFKAWKAKKAEEKQRKEARAKQTKMDAISAEDKKRGVGLSGRELFTFNADLFEDDEEAGEMSYAVQGSDDEGENDKADSTKAGDSEGKAKGDDVVDESLFLDDDDDEDDD